jgi:hypothetical protein
VKEVGTSPLRQIKKYDEHQFQVASWVICTILLHIRIIERALILVVCPFSQFTFLLLDGQFTVARRKKAGKSKGP